MQKTIITKSGLFVLFALISTSPLAIHAAKEEIDKQDTKLEASIVELGTASQKVSEKKDLHFSDSIEVPDNINQPNITAAEIRRGWYFASQEGKKYGTPESWVFISEVAPTKWAKPDSLVETDTSIDNKNLCLNTAGQSSGELGFSCICSGNTQWYDGQGCILKGSRGSFVAISQLELDRGYYQGLITEKKLNTPPDWQWQENGENSIWRKP